MRVVGYCSSLVLKAQYNATFISSAAVWRLKDLIETALRSLKAQLLVLVMTFQGRIQQE